MTKTLVLSLSQQETLKPHPDFQGGLVVVYS